MAENISGLVTPQALPLVRTKFVDEQDRFNEYAKSLRIPVEAGKTGSTGVGTQGEKGEKGDKGEPGDSASLADIEQVITSIPNGVDELAVPGDMTKGVLIVKYSDPAAVAPTPIGVLMIQITAVGTSRIFLSATTGDANYQLVFNKFS
jgi:hypothetical protein